jgi:hypothetical protein
MSATLGIDSESKGVAAKLLLKSLKIPRTTFNFYR